MGGQRPARSFRTPRPTALGRAACAVDLARGVARGRCPAHSGRPAAGPPSPRSGPRAPCARLSGRLSHSSPRSLSFPRFFALSLGRCGLRAAWACPCASHTGRSRPRPWVSSPGPRPRPPLTSSHPLPGSVLSPRSGRRRGRRLPGDSELSGAFPPAGGDEQGVGEGTPRPRWPSGPA